MVSVDRERQTMAHDSNTKTTAPNTSTAHTHHLASGEVAAAEPTLFPEITQLQRTVGNRVMSSRTDLLSRQLLHTSNRSNVVQRVWPFSSKQTMPIADARMELQQLDFSASMAESLWQAENTPAAGQKALDELISIQTKIKALKSTVSDGKYSGADAEKKTEFMREVEDSLAQVASKITTTRQAINALKLQATVASTGASSYPMGGMQGPQSGFDKGMDTMTGGAKTGLHAFQGSKAFETGTRSGQLLGAQNKSAMWENATGGELETNAVQETGRGGVQGFLDSISKFVTSIKESIFNISWVKKIIDFLEPLKNYTFLIGILSDAYSLYSAYDRYTALKAGSDDATTTGATDDVAQSLMYGYAKVKRALYWNIGKFGIGLSKTIARLVTLLTGGATALVTESIALAADLATAAMTLGRKAKGIYKAIRGTRGKARLQNAGVIYDRAMQGDARALKLMIALKPFGLLSTIKNKTFINNIPTTEHEMLPWMQTNATDRRKVVQELADKLKSQ